MIMFIFAAIFGSLALGYAISYAAGYLRMKRSGESFIRASVRKEKKNSIVPVCCK